MPTPYTQLIPLAVPGRRYGSFAGKEAAVPEVVPVWTRTDSRMGRFAEVPTGVRYLELVLVELPPIWDITAGDYVIASTALDIRVELSPIIMTSDVCWVRAGGAVVVMVGWALQVQSTDVLSLVEMVSLAVRPSIQVHDTCISGSVRQKILEAERLLGISIDM